MLIIPFKHCFPFSGPILTKLNDVKINYVAKMPNLEDTFCVRITPIQERIISKDDDDAPIISSDECKSIDMGDNVCHQTNDEDVAQENPSNESLAPVEGDIACFETYNEDEGTENPSNEYLEPVEVDIACSETIPEIVEPEEKVSEVPQDCKEDSLVNDAPCTDCKSDEALSDIVEEDPMVNDAPSTDCKSDEAPSDILEEDPMVNNSPTTDCQSDEAPSDIVTIQALPLASAYAEAR